MSSSKGDAVARTATRGRRLSLPSLAMLVAIFLTASPVKAVGGYDNAAIADKALTYVGQWGGNACNDAQKQGDSGGQCRAFVNCIVWMVSGHTQNLGGSDYFQTFLNAGGTQITDITRLVKGDIVQVGQGTHTFIIVGKVSASGSSGTFGVVDSNHMGDEKVMNYDRTFTLDNSTTRAYRMGTVNSSVTAPTASVGSLFVKREGNIIWGKAGLADGWTQLTQYAAGDLKVAGTRIAFRDTSGNVYAKDGLNGTWYVEGYPSTDEFAVTSS